MDHPIFEHVATRRRVRLTRNRPSDPRLNGYVLAASDRLALVHPFDDFEPDGYAVVRMEDVTGVERGEHEAFWDRMLAGEGLLEGLEAPLRVDLSGIPAAVESIAVSHWYMAIHCEDPEWIEDPVQDLYIGELVRADDEVVWFRHFDAQGRWDPEHADIETDEITMIEFSTPYIKRITRYLSEPA